MKVAELKRQSNFQSQQVCYAKVKVLIGKEWDPEILDGSILVNALKNLKTLPLLACSRPEEVAHTPLAWRRCGYNMCPSCNLPIPPFLAAG